VIGKKSAFSCSVCKPFHYCHSRESGNPDRSINCWIPACAGMTKRISQHKKVMKWFVTMLKSGFSFFIAANFSAQSIQPSNRSRFIWPVAQVCVFISLYSFLYCIRRGDNRYSVILRKDSEEKGTLFRVPRRQYDEGR
jgi:hypothetical protein